MQRNQIQLERTFSQADFDLFARLSGDDNPIHTNPEFAANSRFGRVVSHGVLLCSVLRGLVEQLAPGGVILEQSVMFPAPTFTGEPMCFRAVRVGAAADNTKILLEVRRVTDDEVTCQGHCLVRL